MANTGFKGLDVRQTGNQLVFRSFLQTSAGALLGTGTTVISIIELQSDATIKSYDFNDNTFKTTALTTPTLAMTHRPSNNAGTTTGYWTVALSTLTGFTVGGIYTVFCNNSGASPTDQAREFQYGSAEGDLKTTANGTGVAELNSDVLFWNGTAVSTPATAGIPEVNVKNVNNVSTSPVTTIKAVQGLATDGVVPTVTTVTNQLSAAAIATGVWQDATAGDFTTASSIGKALYINNVAPGAAGGHFIAGSNAGTTTVGALTITGTLTTGPISCGAISSSGAFSVTAFAGNMTGDVQGNVNGDILGSLLGSLTSAERNAIADAYLNRADGIRTGWTPKQAANAQLDLVGGKWSYNSGTGEFILYKSDGTSVRLDCTLALDDSGRTIIAFNA